MPTTNYEKNQDRLTIGLKLNDTKWMLWEFAMIPMLRHQALYDHLKGSSTLDDEQKSRLMMAITTNIEAEQMVTILGYGSDLRGAWAALKAEHAGKSSQDIATITIELSQMKLKTGATIEHAKRHFSDMAILAS